MPGPLIDTGSDEALARGLGLGLQAAHERAVQMYQSEQTQHRALLDELARERLQNTATYQSERANISEERNDLSRQKYQQNQDIGGKLYDSMFPTEDAVPYAPGMQPMNPQHANDRAAFAEANPAERRDFIQNSYHPSLIRAQLAKNQQKIEAIANTPLDLDEKQRQIDKLEAENTYLNGSLMGVHLPTAAIQPHRPATKSGKPPVTPEEATARYNQFVGAVGGEKNLDPLMIPILKERTSRGEKISADDMRMSMREGQLDDAGEIAALKIERDDAKHDAAAIEKEYTAALAVADGKVSGVDADVVQRYVMARRRVSQASTALTERERNRKGAAAHSPAPAPSAPSPAPSPITPDDIAHQIQSEMPNATPEQKAAEYRRRKGIQ